ncbi:MULTISPECIES: flavodoxin domain-containing protein [unclassified Streptomyces]|uniref:flavodoxin domain-containing protein n=1 Tax=unclassified Streptomyces TaxID=2593676 RepID=UPI0036E661DC
MDVLVGFATAHGSTREIAERLAAKLSEAGLKAEARAMETVDDADAYRAFVLGSAVHRQAWLEPAKEFVRDNLGLLGARPVWLFSVGNAGRPARTREALGAAGGGCHCREPARRSPVPGPPSVVRGNRRVSPAL